MATYRQINHLSPRLWIALAATLFAGLIAVLASLNLYLLEDGNPLTTAAYSASPLLRFSYDGAYLSALVTVVTTCTLVGYALVRADIPVLVGLISVALLVALAGFGGLLVRYPATFLALFLAFAGLILISVLAGRVVASRLRQRLGQRPAALLGACVSTGIALFVNLAALISHTLALNPVSHLLYMQGQIGGTHFNSLLVALALGLLSLIACLLGIGFALRSTARLS